MTSRFPLTLTRFLAAGLAGAVKHDIHESMGLELEVLCSLGTNSPNEENAFGSRKGVNAYSLDDLDDIDSEQENSGRLVKWWRVRASINFRLKQSYQQAPSGESPIYITTNIRRPLASDLDYFPFPPRAD